MSATKDEGPRTKDGAERLWSYEDLALRWGISPRRARDEAKRMGLRPLTFGHRTVRFRPVAVIKAEETKEMGPRRRGWLGGLGDR